jgi:glycogen phosphorylase
MPLLGDGTFSIWIRIVVFDDASGYRAISNDHQTKSNDSANAPAPMDDVTSGPPPAEHSTASLDRAERPPASHTFSAQTPAFLAQVRSAEMLREAILRHVRYTLVRPTSDLKPVDYLNPVSLAIRDRIVDRMLETELRFRHKDTKRLYYLSVEFLMGRSLGDNLSNLRIEELCGEVLASFGVSLDEVLDSESDTGLGNGGLGRLAACFLESLATLGMPGYGYGIDYEYGLFKQEIVGGFQREKPDRWKANGTPFQIEHPEEAISIPMYGRLDSQRDADGKLKQTWINYKVVLGIPTDMPIVGYLGQTVNWLRLFTARASEDFDIDIFNRGDYIHAVEQKIASENISRVLYPSDSAIAGKELRLVQEYFLVACAIGDIMRRFRQQHDDLELLPAKAAIQMNDTHPSLAVAELMRVLIDQNGLPFEKAWDITVKTLAYTNHTLLPEALEKWSVPLMEKVLPRHVQIIFSINDRFLHQITDLPFMNAEKLRKMSIIEEGYEKHVRMANLCIVGSHSVNGVSALHSDLVVKRLVPEFAELWPEKFNNKTNGVAPRRWLMEANPGLTDLISQALDEQKWITDLSRLRDLEPFAEKADFRAAFKEVKRQNKLRLAESIQKQLDISVDPDSIFDVQIKRIHEYKRQLLAVMHVIHDYLQIVDHGHTPVVARTYVFAGKAAPGYWAAKQIIKLIHNVADVVNNDARVKDAIKVTFLPDYRVSLATLIIPGADVSEQISTAGMEASGTGNMKLSMNGALTVGTWDGANIEIAQEVGLDNIFIFGLRAEEILEMQQKGTYNPRERYDNDPAVKEVMDALASDRFCPNEHGLFRWIFDELVHRGDKYYHIADFPSYVEIQKQVSSDYRNDEVWCRKSILNVARIGKFSSDRTVMEYARDIWHIGPYEKSAPGAKVAKNHVAALAAPPVLNGEAIPIAELKPEPEPKPVPE